MKVSLKRINGVLKVDIDGKPFNALSFKSFRPSDRNISDFAKAGIRLFSIMISGLKCAYDVPYSEFGESWFGIGEYNFDTVDRQIELFRKNAPECYFAIMIHIDAREWWYDTHSGFPRSFTHLSQAIADNEWREATADYLTATIKHIEEKYGDCVYGYFMLCGRGTEWFSARDYQASHPIKEKYWKEYTGNPDAVIPSKERLELSTDTAFYEDPEVILYQKAHAELIVDTILYFSRKAQSIIEHRKLLGLYFGYLMEFKNYINDAGHLAYEKIYFSKDIDMISSPAAYEFREPDSTSAFMTTYSSLDLNNKLYFYEYDQRTYLSQEFTRAGGGYYCKTDKEAVDLMRRDFMLCMANNSALWWFDMFEGWYSSDEMMKNVADMVSISERLYRNEMHSVSQVALIGSPESFYKANKNNELHDLLLYSQREGYMRMGAPFDLYTEGDMSRIDFSQYKLVVFLNGFDLKPANDKVIEQLKKKGKTIMWLYAPAYLRGGLDKMKEITGMELEAMKQKPVSSGHGRVLPSPNFCVTDKDAVSLSEYNSGESSVAYKDCGGWTSVYSGVGLLDEEILKKICRIAGVHIYSDTSPVYVNNSFIGIYSFEDTVISVKQDGVYEDVFTGEKYRSENGKLTIHAGEYASRMLMAEGSINH